MRNAEVDADILIVGLRQQPFRPSHPIFRVGKIRKVPVVQKKIPSKKRFGIRCDFPMEEPKRLNVFQELIVSFMAQKLSLKPSSCLRPNKAVPIC